MKYLIVDDNRNMRETLKQMLGTKSNEFMEGSDGSESIDLFREFHPDWVLMDIRMKQMDGITATRQLVQTFPHAKVLIVTDYNDDKLRLAAGNAGALGFLLKESLSEISAIIEQVQGQHFINHHQE
ncbi:MAG: response regulator transcription factor [Bacteroidota bacterium]